MSFLFLINRQILTWRMRNRRTIHKHYLEIRIILSMMMKNSKVKPRNSFQCCRNVEKIKFFETNIVTIVYVMKRFVVNELSRLITLTLRRSSQLNEKKKELRLVCLFNRSIWYTLPNTKTNSIVTDENKSIVRHFTEISQPEGQTIHFSDLHFDFLTQITRCSNSSITKRLISTMRM